MSAAKIAFLAALAAVAHAASDDTIGFGPAFSLGPTQSWIREANTTIVLPEAPSPQVDRLALWPGMGTSGGDLIQALAVSFTDPSANCDGATAGQWCIWASTLQDTQLGGKMVPADAGDQVTMHYVFNDDTSKYDQTVFLNGKQVSTLSTSSGQAQGWGTAVECQAQACTGTALAHKYVDTTVILNEADTTFAGTLGTNEVTSTGLKTDDNKVFTVETINVQAHTYNL